MRLTQRVRNVFKALTLGVVTVANTVSSFAGVRPQDSGPAPLPPDFGGTRTGLIPDADLDRLLDRFPGLREIMSATPADRMGSILVAQLGGGGGVLSAVVALEAALGKSLSLATPAEIAIAVRDVLSALGPAAPSWAAVNGALLNAGLSPEALSLVRDAYEDRLAELVVAGIIAAELAAVLVAEDLALNDAFEIAS